MIQSEKEYQQQKKDKLLKEYSDAILNGEDAVALLVSEKILDVNHTIDFLAIQENIASNEKYYYDLNDPPKMVHRSTISVKQREKTLEG